MLRFSISTRWKPLFWPSVGKWMDIDWMSYETYANTVYGKILKPMVICVCIYFSVILILQWTWIHVFRPKGTLFLLFMYAKFVESKIWSISLYISCTYGLAQIEFSSLVQYISIYKNIYVYEWFFCRDRWIFRQVSGFGFNLDLN